MIFWKLNEIKACGRSNPLFRENTRTGAGWKKYTLLQRCPCSSQTTSKYILDDQKRQPAHDLYSVQKHGRRLFYELRGASKGCYVLQSANNLRRIISKF